ncbi:MAG: tight adherence protein C [Pirellulaceae bacterium]|jgi:tight adherence protein C
MVLLASFTITLLVGLAVFGMIAAVVWVAADMVTAKNSRAEQRLESLRSPDGKPVSSGKGRMAEMLERATPALAKPLQPQKESEVSALKLRLSYAGFRSEGAANSFLSAKFALLIFGFFTGGGILLLTKGFVYTTFLYTFAVAGLCFYLPELVLMFLGMKRKEKIFLALPDALDLMVVCVEAGLALDQAMRKVADELKKTHPILADEFGLCNGQMQMGKTRGEVLQELGARTGVDDLRALASILIQADKFGSSVAKALRVQSDSMRTRRRQIAEEKAAKTAVKLIFPLVIFIFPGIFIVLVGPAAITMMRELFPRMNGG